MNDQNNAEEEQITKAERKKVRREEKQREREREQRQRAMRKWYLWGGFALGVVVIVSGAMMLGRDDPSTSSGQVGAGGDSAALEVSGADHVKGAADAAVTLIEYGDFQCPACASYHPIVKQLEEELGDRVQFVFRHFPLRQIHPNAQISSQAAEAAGRQGKFWEMHDVLFERQTDWANERGPEDTFVGYAEELGLDVDQFKEDLERDEVEQAVNDGYDSGIKAKVSSTPSFFLNGAKLTNPRTYDEFKSVIEAALAS